MTPEAFQAWLKSMKASGRARSDAECGRLLGITSTSVVSLKSKGADRRTALACRALSQGLEPWDDDQMPEATGP